MFIQKLTKTRAQATVEIALFGTVMLMIFGALLRYGISYNARQEAQMYTFRKTLDLAKRRHTGTAIGGTTGHGQRRFASASLSVTKNVFPVSAAESSVQESSAAGSSASVLIENEASNFGDEDGPEGLEDIGGSYYQIGDKMYKDDTYFEPAYIKIKRKVDKDTPRHPWDSFMDWFNFEGERVDYESYQAMPYREQVQNTDTTSSSQYTSNEESDGALYDEHAETRTESRTVYQPPAYTLDALTQEMYAWDPDVIRVQGVVGYSNNIPRDMVITTDKTFTKQRIWDSEK